MQKRHALVLMPMACWSCWAITTDRCAGISVHFDRAVYDVTAPGDEITAHILIDVDPGTPEDDPLRSGLFSMSLGLEYPDSKAVVIGMGDIELPTELEFFSFFPGAFRELSPGMAGVKGNVDLTDEPASTYGGTLLATFTITNLASAPDSYPLELNFFNTVGPNEQFYFDGDHNLLDPEIMFGAARVRVVPEPAAVVLNTTGLLLLCGCQRLGRRRQ